jgi:glutamate racemase
MNKNPIGVFDSGVGGISVLKALVQQMPHEDYVYLADNLNNPYGSKPKELIKELTFKGITKLLDHSCKLIVVACNTATTAAIHELRQTFDIPFIGIEPAIKPASKNTRSGIIGILATEQTLYSDKFRMLTQAHAQNVKLHIQIGHGLVEAVENDKLHDPYTRTLVHRYINRILGSGSDQIVLGCTHYPFLIPQMETIVKKKATIIDPAKAVALQTERILNLHHLIGSKEEKSRIRFLSTRSDRKQAAYDLRMHALLQS